MKIEPGVIVIAVSMLVFYLRLAMIRGRRRRERRTEELARLRSRRKGRAEEDPSPLGVTYQVSNYYLLALGVVLMLAGIFVKTTSVFPMYQPYWWIFITVGMVAFIVTVK